MPVPAIVAGLGIAGRLILSLARNPAVRRAAVRAAQKAGRFFSKTKSKAKQCCDKAAKQPKSVPRVPGPEAQKIANGHAYQKHVVQGKEFPGIKNQQEFAQHIDNVMKNPSASKNLLNGREAFWQDKSRTLVIKDLKSPDGGTAFVPKNGRAYFDGLK